MDIDLRKLRYFVAVAECAGFRKAAQQLRIAQPALTRQIRSFEYELDAQLFTRNTHGVSLTEAGQQLFLEAEPLLASANAIRGRLADLKNRPARLTIGFAQGILIARFVRAFGRLHPSVEVDLVRIPPEEQVGSILGGSIDVCFARAPLAAPGLEVLPLFEEARVVAMPYDAPLAHVDYLELKDLAAFPLLQDPDSVPEVSAAMGAARSAPGHGASHRGFPPASVEEALEHVASQHGIVILPSSTAEMYSRSDVVFREVRGLRPSQVVVAFATERVTHHTRVIIDIAAEQTESVGRS